MTFERKLMEILMQKLNYGGD